MRQFIAARGRRRMEWRRMFAFLVAIGSAIAIGTLAKDSIPNNNNNNTNNNTINESQQTTTNSIPATAIIATNATTETTSATPRTPSEQEIEQAKKLIQEVASIMKDQPTRLAVNRPITTSNPSGLSPQQLALNSDYAPNSIELLASDATTQFGLNFLKNIDKQPAQLGSKNVVISPLSMQNLLSMLLLGSSGATEVELAQVLGYQTSGLLHLKSSSQTNNDTTLLVDQNERMKPHEALHNVFDRIIKATRFSPTNLLQQQQHQQQDDDSQISNTLLNSNLNDLQKGTEASKQQQQQQQGATVESGQIAAHLQTNEHNESQPLNNQLNFTLANLILTNKDSIDLDANYELDLKHFYNVQMEQFETKSKTSLNKTTTTTTPTSSSGGGGGGGKVVEKKLHERINDWVKRMTQNQINQLVEAGEFDERPDDLMMVLLNAAHFKGRWLHTFAQKATQQQTFYSQGGQEVEVPFMRQKGEFGFAEFGANSPLSGAGKLGPKMSQEDAETILAEDNDAAEKSPSSSNSSSSTSKSELPPHQKLECSALSLPFSLNEGQELSMVFLLPNKRDGLDELMANLDYSTLNEVYKSLQEQQQQVQVEIPKFSFESTHDAKSALEKMGLTRIFDESKADFTRMISTSSINSNNNKVDKVIHKAKIMVDESGAEAAAASLVSIVSRNFVRPTPVFQANHPFLFVIRHSRSNMPLFMGQVNSFS